MENRNIAISAYNYALPEERIAAFPLSRRDASKLLVYRDGKMEHDQFFNLPKHLPANSLLVLNDTRVIEARIHFEKNTGARIEIFCLEPYQQSIEQAMQQKGSSVWKCLIGGASKWKPGQVLQKDLRQKGMLEARYLQKQDDGFLIAFSWDADTGFLEVLHEAGAIPLPPYIKRKAEGLDWERYQTIFNRQEGSVAAPTAALHFTEEVFRELEKKNIHRSFLTLHVGAGTFKPVKTASVADHQMHGEPFSVAATTIEQLVRAEKIIAVGTTSLRTLESLYWCGIKILHGEENIEELGQWECYELERKYPGTDYKKSFNALLQWMQQNGQDEFQCRTSLIIIPGYSIQVPEALVTNFHQPQSTLLLLVAAFIGDDWKNVYEEALQQDYRFLSYGDSSLLFRKNK